MSSTGVSVYIEVDVGSGGGMEYIHINAYNPFIANHVDIQTKDKQ